MTEQVKVTQADREAASSQVEWLRAATLQTEDIEPFFMSDFAEAVRGGVWDNHPFVQAFARHRIAAQAELLEALEFLADAASASKGFASPMALGQARTAIAKAKGEQ